MRRCSGSTLVIGLVATISSGAQQPQQSPALHPLTPGLVVSALHEAGLEVQPAQLHMPASLSINADTPDLHVAHAEKLPGGRLRLQLTCRPQGICLPFLITIDPLPGQALEFASLGTTQSISMEVPHHDPVSATRVQAGQHLTLLLEDTHMRIVLPVVAIDSGSPGAEIRVSSLDHKQLFTATVLQAGAVKGTLP